MKAPKLKSQRPFLSLTNATFRLGNGLVFENTSWVLRSNEQWAILGPNGSGKSLLADALRGLLPIVHGELRHHFRPPDRLAPESAIGHVSFEDRKSGVRGRVVQSRWNSLDAQGGLSVRDFLAYEGVMDANPFEITSHHDKTRPRFERRRRRAIELMGVGRFLNRSLLSLSNGEMQRVHLARVLSMPLRLLILDEPFTGLDVAARAWFRRVLKQLMTTPLRILLIVTRLEDLPNRVTHLLCVERCRVVAAGPRQSVLASLPGAFRPENARRVPPLIGGRTAAHSGIRITSPSHRPAELICLRDVTVRYGNSVLLRGVNWSVRAGESWALLGPNGSGKTTLLSLILGDNPQVYGNDVTVFGIRRGTGESVWDIKQRIGWVSPDLQLLWDDPSDCFAVVASGFHDSLGLFHRPTARQRAAAPQSMARLGLLAFTRTPFLALSAGQQRMVLLARALVKNPQLLVLDEPCQGLDAEHRETFIRAVERLINNRTTTVIFVTHREDEIPRSIRKVLRLSAGKGVVKSR